MMAENSHELKEIGNRIQKIRIALKSLQRDFAAKLGISSASLSEIESGSAKPMFEVYFSLTYDFNVNLNFLFSGKGNLFVTTEREQENSQKNGISDAHLFLDEFFATLAESPLVRYSMLNHASFYLSSQQSILDKNIINQKKSEGDYYETKSSVF